MYAEKSVEEIVHLFRSRQTGKGLFLERCRTISQHYDNEVVLPMPELSKKDRSPVANLLAQGIDQHAMRVASYLPDVQSPPLKPGNKSSEERAATRRRAAVGWMEVNSYNLLQRHRARWLVAYSQAPVMLLPDKKTRQPRWLIRTPLEAFPADLDRGEMQPDDCIFAVSRTIGWLRRTYPDIPVSDVRMPGGSTWSGTRACDDSDVIEVIEYRDEYETVVICLGVGEVDGLIHEAEYGYRDARIINLGPVGGPDKPRCWASILLRTENRLGMPPVVVPGRISLGYPKGQFDDTVGLYQMQAQLMAMEVNAIANGIWPDEWLVSDGNTQPKIVRAADGRTGQVGIAQGGVFHTTQVQPGIQTPQVIDRLERNIRQNGGIPADFGGESASNIRTGRRGANILSEAVDFTLQEHQEILAASAKCEFNIAAQIDLTYFGSQRKSFYVSWKGGKGRLDYTPKDIWTEDKTLLVDYAKPGSDINALNVEIGQLTGIGLISKNTAGRMHPDVKDPEHEQAQIEAEALIGAGLAIIEQQAQAGTLPLTDLAAIYKLRRSGDAADLFEAIDKAHQAAQERQSSTVEPAEPGSPEAQPGLSPPGAGAEAGTVIPGSTPDSDRLTQLLRAVRTQSQAAG